MKMNRSVVVANTRVVGVGVGVSFFPNLFVSIFVILLYCYFSIFGIFPSFMAEISQKNMEHTEATKSLFF